MAQPAHARPPLKRVADVLSPPGEHWVGDGFRVSSVLSPHRIDPQLTSPFVLMDYAAPRRFEPGTRRRGVGEHPHRGFETVTFAYRGEIEHRDSHGGGGKIGPGDIQWMTAASGVVHEEFHSHDFTAQGGVFEMVQLWVNLPARLKMTTPRYQGIADKEFPRLTLGEGSARLIAGRLGAAHGPAKTHSSMTVFDVTLSKGATAEFELEPGTTTLALLLKGRVRAQQRVDAGPRDLILFDRASQGGVRLEATEDTKVLVLNGEPLNEPVVAHGPFVMNTREEIAQAMRDYQAGLMGKLSPQG